MLQGKISILIHFIFLNFFSYHLKISNQNTVKNTFGWVRAELIGMLTTITFIVAMIFSLLIEGALQLFHLHEIASPTNPKVLIRFGIWSLIVNILYVLTINGKKNLQLIIALNFI